MSKAAILIEFCVCEEEFVDIVKKQIRLGRTAEGIKFELIFRNYDMGRDNIVDHFCSLVDQIYKGN